MAHFVLEYSDNLGQNNATIQTLFSCLHEAADATGLFPLKGIRSRGYCCSQYRMANGNPEHGFAHLEVKIGTGRSIEDRLAASASFFNLFCEHFAEQSAQRGVALSFEMRELEPVLKYNSNNIEDCL